MKQFANKYRLIVLLSTGLLVAGCSSTYFKITDPVTKNTYYTEKVERSGGAAEFTDARSGSMVTLQNSEVKEISKQEYEAGLKPAPAPEAAPAAAPAAPEAVTAPAPEAAPAAEPATAPATPAPMPETTPAPAP